LGAQHRGKRGGGQQHHQQQQRQERLFHLGTSGY
jgi:hypothetical protein